MMSGPVHDCVPASVSVPAAVLVRPKLPPLCVMFPASVRLVAALFTTTVVLLASTMLLFTVEVGEALPSSLMTPPAKTIWRFNCPATFVHRPSVPPVLKVIDFETCATLVVDSMENVPAITSMFPSEIVPLTTLN